MAERSTVGAELGPQSVMGWLNALCPEPPPVLLERLRLALTPFGTQPVGQVPEACLSAGEALLDALLLSGSTARGSALDLLTVDALVTYAFQAAADMPESLETRGARAMSRIAMLAGDRS